jgi:hypothetical protein
MKPFKYLRRHKEGDDVPYIMGGAVELLVFLILSVFSLAVVDHYMLGKDSLASVISAVLVDLTNGDRTSNALGGLTVSPVLTAAAQAKADDMAAKSYFAHVSPDGHNSWYWFSQAGYKFIYAGENLAVDFSDSTDVERAWMNSPTHRRNLLDGNFTQIGIAVAQGTFEGRSTTFVVQMFGTPAPTSAPAPVRTVSLPIEATSPAIATTKPKAPAPAKVVAPVIVVATTTPSLAVATTAPATTTVAGTVPTTRLVLGTEAVGLAAPAVSSVSWWEYLLVSPKTALRSAYYILAGMILALLAYATELEFHQRHLRHVAAAASLFVLMIGLSLIANFILFTQPVIAAFQY